jgi:cytosine/adenosine deaminase-related metal-dependent hydrolase
MRLLTAPWVVPVVCPPIPEGALLIDGARILRVGTLVELRAAAPAAPVERFEDAALVPALVNAHAHLELTDLAPLPEGGDFVSWIKAIIAVKRAASEAQFAEAVALGAARCLAGGQAVVADVLSRPVAAAYSAAGPRIVCQIEVICPADEGARVAVEAACRVSPPDGWSDAIAWGGLFAHSPYTVGAEAFRLSHKAALSRGGKFFTHIAESGEEIEFCATGGGPVAEKLYAGLPVTPPAAPRAHPVDWLDAQGLLGPETVLVHAVHLLPEHPALLRSRGAGVALCPRSNRRLGVGVAPGRALLKAGVEVGLGTDSSLSAGDLDLFQEMLAAVDDYGWTPAEALRAATLGGARLLGLEGTCGAFSEGASADILALGLNTGNGDVFSRIFSNGTRRGMFLGGLRIGKG